MILFEIMDTDDVLNNLYRLIGEKEEIEIIKKFLREYKECIDKE
jgi:hypothetical protein